MVELKECLLRTKTRLQTTDLPDKTWMSLGIAGGGGPGCEADFCYGQQPRSSVPSRMAAVRSVTAIRSADSRSAMGAGYSEDCWVLGAGTETLPLLGTLKQTFCVGQERAMDANLARGHLRAGVDFLAGFVEVLAL
jgi:hypothetical protein